MNIILFGGNSQRNKQWIHEVGDTLSSDFDTCLVHDYDHWEGQGEFINFDVELATLRQETDTLNNYIVFAKSVGSILTLKAISEGILRPDKCAFAGLPIKLADERAIDLKGLLRTCQVPLLFMQNTDDPLASYSRLTEFLSEAGISSYESIELAGEGHSYDDLDRLRTDLIAFI